MKKIKFQSLMTWNNSHVFAYQKEATPYLKIIMKISWNFAS